MQRCRIRAETACSFGRLKIAAGASTIGAQAKPTTAVGENNRHGLWPLGGGLGNHMDDPQILRFPQPIQEPRS